MVSVHDVGAYILDRTGEMSTWKLQKLVYYAQAWHLVWDNERLFSEPIQAWANGPVSPALYRQHRGLFAVKKLANGDARKLNASEAETVDLVLKSYGNLTGRQLSHLTHAERPWREAREGLPSTAPSQAEITTEALYDFYSALDADEDADSVEDIDWDALAG